MNTSDNYLKVQTYLSVISKADSDRLHKAYSILSKNFSLQDLKRVFDDPKSVYEDMQTKLSKLRYRDLVRILTPVFIALSTVKLFNYIRNGAGDSFWFQGADGETLFKMVITVTVLNIFMLIIERKYIKEDKKTEDSLTRLLNESGKNWSRFWQELKAGQIVILIKDMIKTSFEMTLKYGTWQYEIAKKDTGYSVLFVSSWLVTFACVYMAGKISVERMLDTND